MAVVLDTFPQFLKNLMDDDVTTFLSVSNFVNKQKFVDCFEKTYDVNFFAYIADRYADINLLKLLEKFKDQIDFKKKNKSQHNIFITLYMKTYRHCINYLLQNFSSECENSVKIIAVARYPIQLNDYVFEESKQQRNYDTYCSMNNVYETVLFNTIIENYKDSLINFFDKHNHKQLLFNLQKTLPNLVLPAINLINCEDIINNVNENGDTVLMSYYVTNYSFHGYETMICDIINKFERVIDYSISNKIKNTLLLLTAKYSNYSIVEKLLNLNDKNINPYQLSAQNENALLWLVYRKKEDLAQNFVSKYPDKQNLIKGQLSDHNIFGFAIANNMIVFVRKMIELECEIKPSELHQLFNLALSSKQPDFAIQLLEHLDLSKNDVINEGIFYNVCKNGLVKVAEYILENKTLCLNNLKPYNSILNCLFELKQDEKFIINIITIYKDHSLLFELKIINKIIDHKMNDLFDFVMTTFKEKLINLGEFDQSKQPMPPFFHACQTGSEHCALKLFEESDEMNNNNLLTQNQLGQTPLILACNYKMDSLIAKILTYSNCFPFNVDENGDSAIDILHRSKNYELIRKFIDLNPLSVHHLMNKVYTDDNLLRIVYDKIKSFTSESTNKNGRNNTYYYNIIIGLIKNDKFNNIVALFPEDSERLKEIQYIKEIFSAYDEKKTYENDNSCLICCSDSFDMYIIKPCNHVVRLDDGCKVDVKECPSCRSTITSMNKCYMI